jgi:hypothetical protein
MNSVVKSSRTQRRFFYLTCENYTDGCHNLIVGRRGTRRYCSTRCAGRDNRGRTIRNVGPKRACFLCASIYQPSSRKSWYCEECKPWVDARSRAAGRIAKDSGEEPWLVLWKLYQRKDDRLCDACGRPFEAGERGRYIRHVDHDHNTGRIRGSLCGSCNVIIGMANESIGELSALILYLERQRVAS